MVVIVSNDHEVHELVDAGTTSWFQSDPRELEADERAHRGSENTPHMRPAGTNQAERQLVKSRSARWSAFDQRTSSSVILLPH